MRNQRKARYFAAAQEILSTGGYGALKLAAVCKHLDVTTGAFYHSFENWNTFTREFLQAWHEERTTYYANLTRAESDPAQQALIVASAAMSFDHRSEAAIRAWAHIDPEVEKIQIVVDQERYEVVLEVTNQLVGADDGPRFAKWAISTLIGFEQLTHQQTRDDLVWQLEQLVALAIGIYEQRKADGLVSA